jgi:hypothetical protein
MRSKYILIAVALVALGFGVGRLSAAVGTLDSPDVPGNTWSFTLEDIYNRLDTGAAGAQSTFTEPAAGPGTGTMHTLDQIMAKAPLADNTNGAEQTEVLTGKTYWSLRTGPWGQLTGTMPDNGAVTIVPTTTNQAIALGYHDGTGHCEGDADLVGDKIKQGVDMFGVTGTVIEATGDATAGDVLTGKTFSNASAAGIAGTMPDNGAVTIVPTTTNQTIAMGYHNGSGKVEGDADLVSCKIRRGVNLFGVVGSITNVPATGQTGCWDQGGSSIACAGTGQDGEYQLGCLPAVGPCAGADGCNFNRTSLPWNSSWGPGFTEHGDGTVTDNLTGLIWLKNANCFGLRTWTQALSDANGLASGSCGLTDGSSAGDWRLPNINELRSLIDPDTKPAIPSVHPFWGVQSYYYWSSTTYANDTDRAWDVHLDDGYVNICNKTGTDYVWPVRGGQ